MLLASLFILAWATADQPLGWVLVGGALMGAAFGFSGGLTDASARGAAFWVFAAVLPLALIGTWATFRMTGSARAVAA
jgi:hypothetical protein